MNNPGSNAIRYFLLIAGAVIALSGVLRLADQGNIPYNGFITDGNNTVIRVDAGGPAERAGLKAGDYIRSIDGIPVEDSRALARQERPQIGQIGTLVVEIRGEGVPGPTPLARSIEFAYAPAPQRYVALGYAAFCIGLCFLVCGLIAYIRIPSRSGALFALTGLCLGASFLGTPYFSSFAVRSLMQAVLYLIVVSGFAFLFHLMLEFPKRKRILQKKYAIKLLYGFPLIVAAYALFLIVLQPPATSSLNQLTRLLFGIFIVVYFSGAAIAIVHSYATASSEERTQQGLSLIMGGILLGILPVTIALILGILAPRLVLPGVDFYFLTLILIPVALLGALSRRGLAECSSRMSGHVAHTGSRPHNA